MSKESTPPHISNLFDRLKNMFKTKKQESKPKTRSQLELEFTNLINEIIPVAQDQVLQSLPDSLRNSLYYIFKTTDKKENYEIAYILKTLESFVEDNLNQKDEVLFKEDLEYLKTFGRKLKSQKNKLILNLIEAYQSSCFLFKSPVAYNIKITLKSGEITEKQAKRWLSLMLKNGLINKEEYDRKVF